MKTKIISFLMAISFFVLQFESAANAYQTRKKLPYEEEDEPPVSLAYTHILPSAFVIPAGKLVLGTSFGLGFFDIFDLSTNLFLDFEQVFNISTKVAIWHGDQAAFALYASYYTQTANILDVNGNPLNVNVGSFVPGGVFSYYFTPSLTGHTGLDYAILSPAVPLSSLNGKSGYFHGTTLHQEFTYGFTSKVAISPGFSYDLTYQIWGAGASMHFGGFQIGAHYYFNVATGALLPILGGAITTTY